MWYQQGHDILLQYWSGPHKFVSCFVKKSTKNQEERNNQWWTYDQWDLLPNQHQKMHGEQEETEQSRKDHGKECPLGIEECAEQWHIKSIVEQTDIGSHLVNNIGNVQTSDSEINQAANQASVKRRIRQWFPS